MADRTRSAFPACSWCGRDGIGFLRDEDPDPICVTCSLLPGPTPQRSVRVGGVTAHVLSVGRDLVDETGVTAILDWEGAHLGDPIEDLGWLCVKSWRFGAIDKPAVATASAS